MADSIIQRFDWTGAQQSKQDRKLALGELVELVNVRRVEEGPGPIRKRLGLDRTTISTFSLGPDQPSNQGNPSALEEAPGTALWRDGHDQLWAQDPDVPTTAIYRGVDARAFPRTYSASSRSAHGHVCKPVTVLAGGDIWQFSMADLDSGLNVWRGYQIAIFDATTRAAKSRTVNVTAQNIVGLTAAVDGSGVVWLFWFESGSNAEIIRCHKWAAPPLATGSPTASTTFVTLAANRDIKAIDAHYLSSTNKIAVVAVALETGTPNNIYNYHAFLDTATGAASGSPAAVTQTNAGGNGAPQTQCGNGISIIPSTGSDGFLYYSFWREKSGAANTIEAVRVKVNTSDLTVADKTVLKEYSGLSGTLTRTLGTTVGYLDGTTEVYFTSYFQQNPAAPDGTENVVFTEKHTFTGSVASVLFQRSAYVAGKPFRVSMPAGTSPDHFFFVLLGFDDGASTRAQRSYLLYRSDHDSQAGTVGTRRTLAATVLLGEGDAIFHGGPRAPAPSSGGVGVVSYFDHQATHIVAPLDVGGNKFVYGLMREVLNSDNPDPAVLEIDMAAVYHSQAEEILVGGVPKFAGITDTSKDLSPVAFPYLALSVTSLGTGSTRSVNRMTYRWVTVKANGNRHRSTAKAPISFTFLDSISNYTLNVPTAVHANGETLIEVYGSVNGGTDMFLQAVVRNDHSLQSLSLPIRPQDFTATGEALDVGGGSLDPAPLPPFRLAIKHRRRTWLGPDPDGWIWPSLEHREGRGPEFNEALAFFWDAPGELQAWAAVDDNTLALAKPFALAVVTGAGPDGLAQGSFDVRTLPGKDGCSNPKAFIQGPLGVYFPRHADGRMCLLTLGGVQEIHQGMEEYVAYVWVGAVDVKSKRELRWYATNGKILVLDYGHPTPDQPWGQWILHENSNLPVWAGARLINGEPVSIETGSFSTRLWKPGTGFTDNGTQIAKRWETGRYAPLDMLGEFDSDRVMLSSTVLGGTSAYTYTLIDDLGNTEPHPDASDVTADVEFRSARFRTRDLRLRVVETTPNGEGRQFDGCAMEFVPYDRPQHPRRRIG